MNFKTSLQNELQELELQEQDNNISNSIFLNTENLYKFDAAKEELKLMHEPKRK